MEYSQRKQIRLQNYDYSQNGSYFITICVQDRKELLGTIVGGGVLDDPIMELSRYGRITQDYILSARKVYTHINISNHVIMPNHIHLIIDIEATSNGMSRTPSPTNAIIPAFISTLKRFINKECGFAVFQRSYHDHIIRNQQEYNEISNYIDTNIINYDKDKYYQNKGVSI